MAYIHVFTWVLVALSIDNFALQLYDLGSEYFFVAPVIPFSFPYVMLHLFILINNKYTADLAFYISCL